MNSAYNWNHSPLHATAFEFFPLGSIKPSGWWQRQLRIQADGMSGHLPEFFPDLGPNSGWLGGTGESWERGPYYLDGMIPLAYLLDDERLIKMVDRWLDWILKSQTPDGHFGPSSLNDWWPFGIILKALTQYHEVTGDSRVIPLMERFFAYMLQELPNNRLHSWAVVRWADTALSIIWLYNRNGDHKLLKLADMLMCQGYNWSYHFTDFGHTQKQSVLFPMRTHVVNNAMGVKTPSVSYQLTGWDEHRKAAWTAIDVLDRYHGAASGIFTGDEHYAGKNPNQGTELCAVVEYMFSLENLSRVLGDPVFGDKLETIAYNALPGTFSADMWSHQYDQQANQVLCTIDKRDWTNNSDSSNIFGVEPNYGCCTSDYHQGWPKLVANSWMAAPDGGLAAITYGPCEVSAIVKRGIHANLVVETDYPFDEKISITVNVPVRAKFPIMLRIPGWCDDPSVYVNGDKKAVSSGVFHTINRAWQNGDKIEMIFPMKLVAERRFNNSITLKRGPVVFALKIGERWEKISGEEPHADYAVYPTTPWNYGLLIDPENPEIEVQYNGVGDMIFGQEYAPIELRVPAKRVPEWVLERNSAGILPTSPVESDQPVEMVTLIPYGCAKLRITEFPLIDMG